MRKPHHTLRPDTAPRAPSPCTTREQGIHAGVTLEEATRVRAYHLWERAGRPTGDGVAYWLEAEAELSSSRSHG